MTVASTKSYVVYAGDGTTTTYALASGGSPILYEETSDFLVYLDGVLKTETTHYSINTGTDILTFVTAPTDGADIWILRMTPRTQELDLTTNGEFDPEAVEAALDKVTREVQDAYREAEHAWQSEYGVVPGTITAGAEDTVAKFDANGDLVAGPSAAQIASAEAYAEYAEEWANKAEDSLISTAAGGDGVDDYSSKHFSIKAADQAGYAEEWAQSDALISIAAGGDGATDRSSKYWSDIAATLVGSTILDSDFTTNGLMRRTGAGVYDTVTVTAAGLAVLDDADSDAQLVTLGGGAAGIRRFKLATAELPVPEDYGAVGDGATDDSAAFTAIDGAGFSHFLVPPGQTYLIDATTAISAIPVFLGGTLKPGSAEVVTLTNGYECGGAVRCFDYSAGGTILIAAPQVVMPDHWGAKATATSATGNAINIIKYAIEATARGSEIRLNGRYVSVPLDFIFDEDNQETAANRDFGKSIVGTGGRTLRLGSLTSNAGTEVEIANGQNDDLVTLTGATRSGPTGSRSGFRMHGITWRGNKTNQTTGGGIHIINIKDAEFHCYGEDFKGIGFRVNNTSPSSNALVFNHVEFFDCDGDNIDLRGAGDSQATLLIAGYSSSPSTHEGVNIKLGSGNQVAQIRAYLAGSHNVQFSGDETCVADMRVNDAGDNNVFFSGSATGNRVLRCRSEDPNQDGASAGSASAAHVQFASTSTNNKIALETDNTDASAQYDIWIGSTTGGNEVTEYHQAAGGPVAYPLHSASGTRAVGNRVAQQRARLTHSATSGSLTLEPILYDHVILTMDGNMSLVNITTAHYVEGMKIRLEATQDGTGSRTLTFGSIFKTVTAIDGTAGATTVWNLVSRDGKFVEESAVTGLTL